MLAGVGLLCLFEKDAAVPQIVVVANSMLVPAVVVKWFLAAKFLGSLICLSSFHFGIFSFNQPTMC